MPQPDPRLVAAAETYRQRTRAHADRVAAGLVAAWLADGPDRYVPFAVAGLVTATVRAGLYATVYTDTAALVVGGEVTATEWVDEVDEDRLVRAAGTAGRTGEASVARLGRSEPLQAGQRALSQGFKSNPQLERWTRHIGGRACPLCARLAGAVLPATVSMARPHPTCSCVQVPV